MKYTLWVEGYLATGEHGVAQCLGAWDADTFSDAVGAWNQAENPGGRKYGTLKYNAARDEWSVWGCVIFDNEEDARRNFG